MRAVLSVAVETAHAEHARRIAATVLGGTFASPSVATVTLPSHRNVCFRVDAESSSVVVKILVGEKLEARLSAQVRAQQLARKGRIPVPTVLASGRWSAIAQAPSAYIVQSWAPGDTAERRLADLTRSARSGLAEQLGETLGTLHDIPGDVFVEGLHEDRPYRNWRSLFEDRCARLVREVAYFQALSPARLNDLKQVIQRDLGDLDFGKVTPRLTHRDLHLGNVIVANGGISAIVDWESARFYDPLWEFARLHSEVFSAWPELRAPLTAGYSRRQAWPADAEARIALYLGAERLSALSFFTHRYPDPLKAETSRKLLLDWLDER